MARSLQFYILFGTFVHLLHEYILYIVYLMLLAIGLNKIFLIPDSYCYSVLEMHYFFICILHNYCSTIWSRFMFSAL